MKRALQISACSVIAALPLLFLSGCYTQMGVSRGDEGYGSEGVQSEQYADSTQQENYDAARERFYYDNYYPPYYPSYSIGIGFGWHTPWWGYGSPWGWYDWYPWYGYSPYWSPYYYPGYTTFYGAPYYGRGYAVRRYGMARTNGGSRSGTYAVPTGGSTVNPAGRTEVRRGAVTTGRRTIAPAASTRVRGTSHGTTRNQPAVRAPSTRSYSPPSGARSSGGRGYSAPSGGRSAPAGAPAGGGSRGGGGGSHGGGGGSRGGGGRR